MASIPLDPPAPGTGAVPPHRGAPGAAGPIARPTGHQAAYQDAYRTTYSPVQLIPAEGWRAAHLVYDTDPHVPTSWETVPLVAWALCEPVRWHHATGKLLPQDRDSPEKNAVHGMTIIEGSWVDVTTTPGTFWMYLGPGVPNPTPEMFEARQRLLRARAEQRAAPEMEVR